MPFLDLYQELTGAVPKLPVDFARTLVNRAWADIRRQNLWSFQLFEANWTSPAVINAGTVTTTQGATTVVFDTTASTAIAAVGIGPFPTPITQRQFRVGIGTIYNIWALANNAGIITLTLDRPYAEAGGAGIAYMIYQCYYPAPMKDFWTWINVRDIINFNDLDIYTSRKEIDMRDPQRSIFYLPTNCMFYQNDQNTGGATPGFPLFELWGQPNFVLTYQLYGIRRGLPLVNDTDTLPSAVGEDCVQELAKVKAYEWAEANKGDMPRNAGADFKFLIGAAMAEYKRLYRDYRRADREQCDNWFEVRRRRSWLGVVDGFYNSIGNTANPGSPWVVVIAAGISACSIALLGAHVPFLG